VKRAVVAAVAAASLVLVGCESSAKSSAPTSSELMLKALNAQSTGNPTLASNYYNDVIELDPQNKLAYYNLGLIAESQENYAVAEDNFRVALRIDPAFDLARKSLAKVQAQHTAADRSG
jgi:Tfp pilus assembly protein PilF